MGRMATLFAHFYQPDTDPGVARMVAEDWWDTLGGLSEAAVAEACRRWLREGQARRPAPSELYALAVASMPRPRLGEAPERLALAAAPRVIATPEDRARILAEAGMTEDRLTRAAPKRMDTSPAEEARP